MAPPERGSTHPINSLVLIYRSRKDERLSWCSWLTYSGRFTHIVVTRRLQAARRTGKVRRPMIGVLPLCHATRKVNNLVLVKQRYDPLCAEVVITLPVVFQHAENWGGALWGPH